MLERVVNQLLHQPLDLVTLEDKYDLICREIDAVGDAAEFRQIEDGPLAISSSARGPLPSFRRATIATRSIDDSSSLRR